MNEKRTFSVVIPTFNSSDTIIRALQSISAQIYPAHEVIIIDDDSDDYGTLVTNVNQFINTDININLIKNDEKVNAAFSRNRAIDLADGNFVAFLDSDDEWEEDKLYRFDQEINILGDQHVYFSQVAVILDGNFENVRPFRSALSNQDISEYLFLQGGFVQTSSIVVSKAIAKEIKFDERFQRHQDYDFCLRAAKSYQFKLLEAPLTRYHITKIKHKRESSEYSLWWLDQMKGYMSKNGYFGYMLFPLSARLMAEKQYIKLLKNMIRAIYGLGIKGTISSRGKLADVLFALFK